MRLNLPCFPVLLLLACGNTPSRPAQSFAGLTRVSSQSPFPTGCPGTAQPGTIFRSAEVEPFLAVDPHDARHLIGVWQQDRWSNGGSNGLGAAVSADGGATWSSSFPHFTTCAGGSSTNRANFERASDPWITFAADSTPYFISFSFNHGLTRQAMLVARSPDGGHSWSEPIFLTEEANVDVAIDKESITADPSSASLVYAVWDRVTGITNPAAPTGTGPAFFTRTTDGGQTWETPRIIHDPGQNAQTISNQIVVLPDGTLIDLLVILTQMNQASSPASVAVLRSSDKGVTWSQPVVISSIQALGVRDPKNCTQNVCDPVRSGDVVPAIAVDRVSGALYAAWEDSRFTANARDGIALSRSGDGGLSWSLPVRVNGAPAAQAFTPAISVAQGGKVGVTYYDLRNDNPGDATQLLATVWLAVSSDNGATWQESAAGGPFDLRSAARTDLGFFVGDYSGLISLSAGFIPLFALANNGNGGNPSDVFARPGGAAASASWNGGDAVAVAPRLRAIGPRRVY